MALSYNLEICTELTPSRTLEAVASTLGLTSDCDCSLRGAGVIASAAAEDEIDAALIYDSFGFRPTVNVRFRLLDKSSPLNGDESVIKSVISILAATEGDAVLLFNSEEVILQRIGGRLTLNADWWEQPVTASLRRHVTAPHEVAHVESPLLV